MRRLFFFIATNLAVVLLLGLILNWILPAFGLQTGQGVSSGLLAMALVFGMGGAFISLLMSKWIAKNSTGAQVITHPASELENWLVNTVARQARMADIGMPEVAVYEAPEVNAFATGANRNNALVAVSTGLLQTMNREEIEAVLAHEVSHIANGDMVTLTLIQGVLNTFVIVLARVIGGFVDNLLANDRERGASRSGGFGYYVVVAVAEIGLGLLASIVVMWFSRLREFRADAGASTLASGQKMIAALEKLRRLHEPAQLPREIAAFGITGGGKLFSSHPPLEERIAALRQTR